METPKLQTSSRGSWQAYEDKDLPKRMEDTALEFRNSGWTNVQGRCIVPGTSACEKQGKFYVDFNAVGLTKEL